MKAIFLCFAAALCVYAEADLNCSGRDVGTRFVPHCELRESTVWFNGETVAVRNEGSGGITVLAGEGPDVQMQAQVLTGAGSAWEAAAVATQVEIEAVNGEITIRGPRTDGTRTWSVHLLLRVPPAAALKLRNINGRVEVENVRGNVEISNVNGGATLTAVSGNIVFRGVNGVFRAAIERWNNQSIEAVTVNGGIELGLPSGTDAHATLSCTAGSISAELPGVNWTISGVAKNASFDIGRGGAGIRGELVAGHIRVYQAR